MAAEEAVRERRQVLRARHPLDRGLGVQAFDLQRGVLRIALVAHHLVHGPFVPMDGLHHAFEHGIEDLSPLLGVAVGQQLHRPLEVGERHRDLPAFAFEGAPGGEDLLGKVLGVYVSGEPSFRSGLVPVSEVPHSPQNFCPGGFESPQPGQRGARRAPHSPQNFR